MPAPRKVSKPIQMHPIGYVRNDVKEPKHDGWDEVESEIVLDAVAPEALDGIEEYSHIQAIFWMDRVTAEQRRVWKVHPRGRQDLPLVGVFATRTPHRPNPMGLTTVELLERRGSTLRVKGLDALDGTAVLDIKPPSPKHDLKEVRFPEWVKRLQG